MPQIKLENVTLTFCQNMTRESQFGGYSYSFIIDEQLICDKVREALAIQKTKVWNDDLNTNKFIIKKANFKHKDDITHEATANMMKDTDVMITVKSKTTPIQNTEGCNLSRGTIADVLVDFFEFEYGKKQMICVRAHAEKGCTVRPTKIVEFTGGVQYFEAKSPKPALDIEAIDEVAF